VAALKILALHGYHGSGQIMRYQTAALSEATAGEVEFIYADAPSLAAGDFGWWQDGFSGWERSRDWAIELAAKQPFDGVLGFSQGAALAGLLAAVKASQPAGPLQFGFAIMIGGFTSHEPEHAHLFTGLLKTPSLHVAGSADPIVPIQDSLLLAERFANPVIMTHPAGHLIPTDAGITRRIANYVLRYRQGARVDSVPGGGLRQAQYHPAARAGSGHH
jgi:pimeloyl-ACP methyl ester carboxylesterase